MYRRDAAGKPLRLRVDIRPGGLVGNDGFVAGAIVEAILSRRGPSALTPSGFAVPIITITVGRTSLEAEIFVMDNVQDLDAYRTEAIEHLRAIAIAARDRARALR